MERLLKDLRRAMSWLKEVLDRPPMWYAAFERQPGRGAIHAHVLVGGIEEDCNEAVACGLNDQMPYRSLRGSRAFVPFDEGKRVGGIRYVTKALAFGADPFFEGAVAPRGEAADYRLSVVDGLSVEDLGVVLGGVAGVGGAESQAAALALLRKERLRGRLRLLRARLGLRGAPEGEKVGEG